MFLFLCIFVSISIPTLADDIFPGSALYASSPQQSWNSPDKLFSLSFIKESKFTYLAAITYNAIPVWNAGGAVDSSAVLQFLQNGNLQLVTGSNRRIVWQSNTAGLGINSAVLDDSGNLVLRNGSSPIWTSFENPTDTVLPGQNFTVDNVLRSGLHSFRLLRSGEMNLQWNDSVVYYTSLGVNITSRLHLTSPSLNMVVGILSLFDPNLPSPVVMGRGNDYGEASNDTVSFLKLDTDGNLRIYSSALSIGREKKIVTWVAVSDQCRVYGYCGDNGLCRYDSFSLKPVCGCPSENFAVDGNGCKRKRDILDQGCQRSMLSLNNTIFLTYPPDSTSEVFTASIRTCSSNCLDDASCIASTYLADGVCYKKRSGLVNGYQSPTITSTSFIKVCDPEMPNPPVTATIVNKDSDAWKVSTVVLGSTLVLVILLGTFAWFYRRSDPRYESLSSLNAPSDYASGLPIQFSYKELHKATKGFKERLGEGGFGSVYRGVLPNKLVVAVKQLEGIEQGEKQFRMEVATISSTHHFNLVRLIGFCSEGRHRLIVYEFMKNGSLDSCLFTDGSSDKNVLNWDQRYKIALGTAKGIMYLHEECRDCILHGDIKPQNILLDDDYNARVSDFGLARLLNQKGPRNRSLISLRGTRGYLAPEWIVNSQITSKADVYSYGMVLLEMASGRRNFEVSSETNHKKFSLWAYEEFEKGNLGMILDKSFVEIDMVQAMRVIEVSFWCIQESPLHRPMMGKVVQMLEGIAEIDKPPSPFVQATVEKLVHPSSEISSVQSSAQMALFSSVASQENVDLQ